MEGSNDEADGGAPMVAAFPVPVLDGALGVCTERVLEKQDKSHKRDPGDSEDDDGSASNEGRRKKEKLTTSMGCLAASLQLLCPQHDVANEVDLLDELDENDHVRTVRGLLSSHVVPRITGVDPGSVVADNESNIPSFLPASAHALHGRRHGTYVLQVA